MSAVSFETLVNVPTSNIFVNGIRPYVAITDELLTVFVATRAINAVLSLLSAGTATASASSIRRSRHGQRERDELSRRSAAH
jgi:hypothetical protein